MDTLTHIVIGACIGDAILGKKIGKRAMFLGAVAQSVPDIDFLASFWLNTANNLLAHRGFTHSVLFAILIIPLLALLSERWHRPHNIKTGTWIWFFASNIFLHIFLDGFNSYGVGWFEPFSHTRFSFNAIFVADPFFSIFPGIAFVALLVLPPRIKTRIKWVRLGLVIPAIYLLMGVINKLVVDKEIRAIAAKENIYYKRYFSTPAPFNNFLWYIILENDSGYNIGYHSVYDSKGKFNYNYFPRNEFLLKTIADNEDLQHLLRFSQGYYTAEKWGDSLVFNDLRFGQEIGWALPKAHFAFHYYLNQGADNKLVVQRGRFTGWNKFSLKYLLKRIRGD